MAIAALGCACALPPLAAAAARPTNTSPPTISGTARQGELLTADRGQWDGTEPITYTYRWRRCTTSGSPCVDVPGGTAQTFRLTAADVGARMVVAVTADNSSLPSGGTASATASPTATVVSVAAPPGDPVVATAGDIACDPTFGSYNGGLGTPTACRQKYTSDLLVGGGLTAVLALGDNQYECAGFNAFLTAFDPTWGRVKSITRPATGNHEYSTSGGTNCDTTGKAKGYFDYFNGAGNATGPAGDRTKGYYSFDIGAWHLIALNSTCGAVGGCNAGSPQEVWLRNDLATHPSSCTLAYWHHPDLAPSTPLWAALYAGQADIVLNGHDHNYQRFAPQNQTIATYDPAAGIRKFVVGTGGRGLGGVSPTPTLEIYDDQTFGVMKLTLHAMSYDWQFVPEAGRTFTDSGSAFCHKGLAASADVSLTKSDAPDPVPPGQPLTYTLTARNSGPASAPAVTVTDTLPAGVSYGSATPSQGSCSQSGGTVTCTLGTLASGASATVDVSVTPQGEGTLNNQASVSSPVADPDSTNNSASAGTTVRASADLSLTKSDAPDPAQAGQPLTYTLGAHNSGPSTATAVTVTDALPAGASYGSAVPSQGSCSESGGTVTCDLGGLASGASASVDIGVTPQAAGTLSNQASVSSPVDDPDTANNSASADTTVSASADLSLTKSDSPDPVERGKPLTYTLTTQNSGPSSPTDVTVTDTLPASVAYDSSAPSQGSCSESGGTVTCDLGGLASGASASVDIDVTPQVAGPISNSASVSSSVADPDATNNSASAGTTVSPPAGYARPRGATPLRVPLVPSYQACTSPNASHLAPIEQPSCSPPVQTSGHLTVGTTDANGAQPHFIGFVRMSVNTNEDPVPNDVVITASLTDVRCKSLVASCGLPNAAGDPDYTGELKEDGVLRLTDKLNGPAGDEAGTVSDTSFPVTVPCTATQDTSVGATCAVTTSANAVLPGSVQTGGRATWQLGAVQVFDGGPDGVVSTPDNSLFAQQGIFVP